MSALSPSATSARASSLDGVSVSKVLPDFEGTHLPLIRSFLGEDLRKSRTALTLTPTVARSIVDGVAAMGWTLLRFSADRVRAARLDKLETRAPGAIGREFSRY